MMKPLQQLRKLRNDRRARLAAALAAAFLAGMVARGLSSPVGSSTTPSAGGRTAAPTLAVAGVGPSRFVDGIPSGFARTEEGARAAAVSYVLMGQTLIGLAPTQVPDAVRTVAALGTAEAQVTEAVDQLTKLRERLSGGKGSTRYLQSVLASRVEAFTPERARVSVWSVGVLSRAGVARPQAAWTMSSFELVWEREDWRVWDESITPGPTPTPQGASGSLSAEQLDAALTDFVPWRGHQ